MNNLIRLTGLKPLTTYFRKKFKISQSAILNPHFVGQALISLLFLFTPNLSIQSEPQPTQNSSVAYLTLIDGNGVQIKQAADTYWKSAQEETLLYVGDTLKTDNTSKAEIQLTRDNSIIRVDSLSLLKIKDTLFENLNLKLEMGKSWIHLKKFQKGGSFEVETPTVSAGVRGTTFRVEVDSEEGDRIAVEEGEVEVTDKENKKVKLRGLMQARFRKKLFGSAQNFSPEKEKRWEKWTEKIVKNRSKKMKEMLNTAKEEAHNILSQSQEIHSKTKEIAKTSQDLIKSFSNNLTAAKQLLDEKESFFNDLKSMKGERRFRRRMKQSPERTENVENIKSKAKDLINHIEIVQGNFETGKEKFAAMFEEVKTFYEKIHSLTDTVKKFEKQKRHFKLGLEKFNKERNFDPQWESLKDDYKFSQDSHEKFVEKFEKITDVVEGRLEGGKEKAKALKDKLSEMHNVIKSNKEEIIRTSIELEKAKKQLEKLLERL